MKMSVRKKVIITLILALPLLFQMVLMPFHIMFQYYSELALILTTLILVLAAKDYYISAWVAFKKGQANMNTLVTIGTLVAYFYSIYAMTLGHEVYFESAAVIILFVLIGDSLEEGMRKRANGALKGLLKLQAKEAILLKNGQEIEIPVEQIKIGDILAAKPAMKFACDGVVVKGSSHVDESMITGESLPVKKIVGDNIVGATINYDGVINYRVTKLGQDTLLNQIIEFVKKAQASKAPIQRLTDKFSQFFVPIVLIIAIITFEVWYVIFSASVDRSLIFAVNVLVIACPCALGLAIPTALMVGTNLSAKHGILIKNGQALEEINQISTIVFDKTGTITKGEPVVTDIVGDVNRVLTLAKNLEQNSEHPLAKAFLNEARKYKLPSYEVSNFQVHKGQGISGIINGQEIFIGNEKMATDLSQKLLDAAKKLENQAKTCAYVGIAGKAIGVVAMQDIPRDNAAFVITELRKMGKKTVILTGDNQNVAREIGKNVGVNQVISEVLPNEKAKEVKKLQKEAKVAFVGDGINDAPALSTADVGVAMGSGTDIAIESGDIVLMQDNLKNLFNALQISKKIFNRIKINLFWAFIYNVIGIPIAAGIFAKQGLVLSPELAGLAMAFSSISVVASSLLLNRTKFN
ncbi:cadmium-translocating P-type ATPase [Lactobacillus mulieris]|uniref:copper-translocating P-type ATPase n=1 Tax=Lactobacillus mulieris TaxID=2508708 RepID=UPI001F40220F|nr:copper-translocating P-type ATPase [Lactobacillus mulieris]MCF1783580.1 cadmium-translocating P-type ATPase [Lactobacillus mulieris]MCW8104166.1 copper-translocating P-type ATPase [Lactobacillus mulieris]